MKIADMDPVVTEWRRGRSRKVGAWSFSDMRMGDPDLGDPQRVRTVYHYGHMMFHFYTDRNGAWQVYPVSEGWGSVSDQNGVNKLVRSYGWYYARDRRGGGPRYERLS